MGDWKSSNTTGGTSGPVSSGREMDRAREWRSPLAILVGGGLLFLTLSGLSIWLLPFSVPNQVMVILHTVGGLAFLVPCLWYSLRHWWLYRSSPMSHIKLLGYVGWGVLGACGASGIVLTFQASFGNRINYGWDTVHIITTLAILAFIVPHLLLIVWRDKKVARATGNTMEVPKMERRYGMGTLWVTVGLGAVVAILAYAYSPPRMNNEFPSDYSFQYGPDRPFAPSLAQTASGGAMDARVLSGSKSCGTAGCHEEIVKEWEVSAHRYAAMDVAFQAIQMNMANQNGPVSTRYCGGCHDPISLFSGTKNIYTDPEQLTALHGYQEGVSCLTCHSVRKVDLKGNANFVVAHPPRYMFELEYNENPTETKRWVRDFLIRAYPRPHVEGLSKGLFKTPEYCASCHKQFIDQEINKVGWVQLQNQFDNWRQSRWNHPGNPEKTIECRECHMPLVTSTDPAAGDVRDYNRTAEDGKHRSHRFIAANLLMPTLLKLPGWEKQVELTEKFLQGKMEIPEIADKWTQGPAVGLDLITPEEIRSGEKIDIQVVITSNKVGHDFPTGPLDIIQAWIELTVKDDQGRVLYSQGKVNDKGFIDPGTFMFKAEPVDQYGNLIDRHNLWEMVGVRHRRALFPGFSDTAEFSFYCPDLFAAPRKLLPQEVSFQVDSPNGSNRTVEVTARLYYRKVDQYLINFLFGEDKGLTSPITLMAEETKTIPVGS